MSKSVLAHIQALREVFNDDSMEEKYQQLLPTASKIRVLRFLIGVLQPFAEATPPEDQPRATTRPTRPGHGAPPPHRGGHHTTQHHHTTPHPPAHPGTWDTTAYQHRIEAAPRPLRTPPHRHHPWKPRTPHASSTPTTGHNPNRTQGQHHRPGQSPASSHTPQPRQMTRFPEHRRTTPHRPPHVA